MKGTNRLISVDPSKLLRVGKSKHSRGHCRHMVCLFVVSMFFQDANSYLVTATFFRGGVVCDLIDRIEKGCSQSWSNIRSLIECAPICGDVSNCSGISVDDKGMCFIHKDCPSILSCSVKHTNHVYYSTSFCDNGGYWMPDKMTCQCQNGWVGHSCRDIPTSCHSLISNGYPGGSYRVILDIEQNGEKLISVGCTIGENGYNQVDILKHNGLTDFNRTWEEYRNGFHDTAKDTPAFIGLDAWHSLSKAGYTTLFVVCNVEGLGVLYRFYYDFNLGNETTGYSFTLGESLENKHGDLLGYSEYTFGDCFGSYQNVPFSTRDRDADDLSDENCAATIGSGWWYKDCNSPCNLLGWGTQFWDSKEPAERMRVLGFDMSKEKDKEMEIVAYAIKGK